MTTFVHCRECGQPLHAQAGACPYCGAPQQQQQPVAAVSVPAGSPMLTIASCVVGAVALLATLADGFPSDREELRGGFGVALAAIACGVLSIYHLKPGRVAAVVGLVTAAIGSLIRLTYL
jgi:hypothetical protein